MTCSLQMALSRLQLSNGSSRLFAAKTFLINLQRPFSSNFHSLNKYISTSLQPDPVLPFENGYGDDQNNRLLSLSKHQIKYAIKEQLSQSNFSPSPLQLAELITINDIQSSLKFVCTEIPIRLLHLIQHMIELGKRHENGECVADEDIRTRLLSEYIHHMEQIKNLPVLSAFDNRAEKIMVDNECLHHYYCVLRNAEQASVGNGRLLLKMFSAHPENNSYFIDKYLIGDLSYRLLAWRHCHAYQTLCSSHRIENDCSVDIGRLMDFTFQRISAELDATSDKRLTIRQHINGRPKLAQPSLIVNHLEMYLKRVLNYALQAICHNAKNGTVIDCNLNLPAGASNLTVELRCAVDSSISIDKQCYSYKDVLPSKSQTGSLAEARADSHNQCDAFCKVNALPICRGYLKYFGGRLQFRPIPGKELKLFVHIPLAESNVSETIPVYNKSTVHYYSNPLLREIHIHRDLGQLHCYTGNAGLSMV